MSDPSSPATSSRASVEDAPTRIEPSGVEYSSESPQPAGAPPAPELAPPPMPLRIGRYAILRRLGQGGMGVVYAAYDDDLDRRVAIKLL
ncbi:MAG: hypothetical protein KC468_09465, partial [Myxococcales bacterium]|nr:hypothetical protein [Myxococcales bacterium]